MRKLCLAACVVITILSACTKIETTTIGAGLLPAVDGVNTLDTVLDVITTNNIDPFADSLKIYKVNDQVIGKISNDPLFGTTTATSYFELKPVSYPFSFHAKTSLIPDSAFLILSYRGIFGDSTAATSIPQTWEVREVTEKLNGDTTYSTNKTFTTGDLLATQTIYPSKLTDSIHERFEDSKNQIRIKLSMAFAQKIIKTFDSASTYSSDSAFRSKFMGFAVMPQTGSAGKALIRINFLDVNTKLALYYKYKLNDEASATQDTAVSYFRFGNGLISGVGISGAANHIVREHAGSESVNTALNDSLAYIQTSPGTYVSVQIPGLSSFPNAIIHRAELLAYELPEVVNVKPPLSAPDFVLLSAYDYTNNIKKSIPNDFIVNPNYGTLNTSVFGGYAERKNVPVYGDVIAYTFNISRYVQGIVTRKDSSYMLRLSAPSNDSLKYTEPYPSSVSYNFYTSPSVANNHAMGQVRLGAGRLHATNPVRMRLRIIYSKI